VQLGNVEPAAVPEPADPGEFVENRPEVLDLVFPPLVGVELSCFTGASTQSNRRSTVNGKITRPYSLCL
jgi:hypothetical protein